MKRIIPAVLFVLYFAGYTYGQPATADEVKALFDEDVNLWWVRYYKGMMNDLHDLTIILGSDGKTYQGYATYLRSNTRFELYGDADGSQLKLYEVDTLGKVSGVIKGTITPGEIDANWQNHTNKIGGTMSLRRSEPQDTELTPCDKGKWVKVYEGLLYEKKVVLIVEHPKPKQYECSFYTEKEAQTFTGFARSKIDNEPLDFKLEDQNLKTPGILTCNNMGTDNISCTYYTDFNAYPFSMKLQRKAGIHCLEYTDYSRTISVFYPQLEGEKKLNGLIFEQYNLWLRDARKTARTIRDSIGLVSPDDRSVLRTYGWYDIEHFDDEKISMRFTFTNTWDNYQTYTLNYDLKNDKEIQLSDILLSNTTYQEYVRAYIAEELKKRPFYKDDLFKEWLKKNPFRYFTLRENGVNFSTKFNTLFGTQSVTVPFDKLEPYLKQ